MTDTAQFTVENLPSSGEDSTVKIVGFGPNASPNVTVLVEIDSLTGDLNVLVGNGPEHIELPKVLSEMFGSLSRLSQELANQPDFWIAIGREQAYAELRNAGVAEDQLDEAVYTVDMLGGVTAPSYAEGAPLADLFGLLFGEIEYDPLVALKDKARDELFADLKWAPSSEDVEALLRYREDGLLSIDPATGYPFIPSTS